MSLHSAPESRTTIQAETDVAAEVSAAGTEDAERRASVQAILAERRCSIDARRAVTSANRMGLG